MVVAASPCWRLRHRTSYCSLFYRGSDSVALVSNDLFHLEGRIERMSDYLDGSYLSKVSYLLSDPDNPIVSLSRSFFLKVPDVIVLSGCFMMAILSKFFAHLHFNSITLVVRNGHGLMVRTHDTWYMQQVVGSNPRKVRQVVAVNNNVEYKLLDPVQGLLMWSINSNPAQGLIMWSINSTTLYRDY